MPLIRLVAVTYNFTNPPQIKIQLPQTKVNSLQTLLVSDLLL
jgi:hypothetical protein